MLLNFTRNYNKIHLKFFQFKSFATSLLDQQIYLVAEGN